MAKGEIKNKIVLEGEAEYKRQMTDAANAVKVLDSEQKLAAAQFRNTGDAQQYAADQARILTDKMQAQQSAVDAAKAALEKLKSDGVDPNSTAYQTWAKKLNDAQTALTDMQTDLDNVQTGFTNIDAAATTTDEKLDSIDKEERFRNTLQAVENMRDRLNSVVSAAAKAARAIWEMEVDAGTWADNLATAASQAGMDVETYQSWQYASRFIDTSVDDIITSYKTLVKQMTSSSEETAVMFNELGVVTRNAEADARAYEETFFDVIDALAGETNETKQAEYAQKLLGGSWRTLMPLIQAGSQAYKDMAKQGMDVAVVSKENVEALGALDDAQQDLNAALDKAKYDTLAALAPTFTEVSKAMSLAVQSFNEFTQSEEGQAALAGLNEALSGLINSFLGEDNGKGTFQAIVEGAKGAVSDFTKAMDWIREHGEEVKTAIAGLGIAWGLLNVAPPVMEALRLIKQINWGGLGGGAEGAAKTAKSAMEAAAGAATGGGFWAGLTATIAKALPWAVGGYVALKPAETDEQQDSYYYEGKRTEAGKAANLPETEAEYWALPDAERRALENANLWDPSQGASKEPANVGGIEGVMEELAARFGEFAKSFDLTKSEAADTGKGIYDAITAAVQQGMDAAEFTKQQYGSELLGQFYTARVGELGYTGTGGPAEQAELQSLYEDLSSVLEQLKEEMTEGGEEAMKNLTDAIDQNAQEAVDAAADMATEAQEATEQGLSDMETLGYNAAIGLANGINMGAVEAIGAANDLAMKVQQSIQSALDIHSPSRVMMQLGEYVSQGFAEGIERNISAVQRAMDFVADATGGGVEPAPAPTRSRAYAAQGGPRRVVIQIDKRQLAEVLVDDMDTELAAKVRPRR